MGFWEEGLKTRHLRICQPEKDRICSLIVSIAVTLAFNRKSLGPEPKQVEHSIQNVGDCPNQVQHFMRFTVYFVNIISGTHVISIAP